MFRRGLMGFKALGAGLAWLGVRFGTMLPQPASPRVPSTPNHSRFSGVAAVKRAARKARNRARTRRVAR